MTEAPHSRDDTMKGIAIMVTSYAVFSLSDASVKWLVADFPVLQVLFVRSLLVFLFTGALGGRRRLAGLAASPNKGWLAITGVAVLATFACYFTAARDLSLAQLVTIYFAAPLIVVILSVVVLREKVQAGRWVAVVIGFAGVVVAADPTSAVTAVPAGLALASAFFWAIAQLLIRKVSVREPAYNQMMAGNLVFVAASAPTLAWSWVTPGPASLALMLFLGLAGGVSQFLLYQAFRYAPATVLAPIEYTALVWAFALGYLIWHDVPQPNVVFGAALIVAGSVGLVWSERQSAHQPVLPLPVETEPEA